MDLAGFGAAFAEFIGAGAAGVPNAPSCSPDGDPPGTMWEGIGGTLLPASDEGKIE
ncbi:MAG: hypothetical protein HKL80_11405 [Acidimicrobiales bacterium]|nr:hypothetical protein [Acidimicrobiales bacterium]